MTHRIIVAFALVLSMPLLAFSATIFSEDYEVADVASLSGHGWSVSNNTDVDGSPTLAIVTAPSGRTGSVLRLQYQGVHSNDNHNASITMFFSGVPEFYERYYLRYDKIDTGQPSGFSNITAKQHYFNVSVLPNALTNFYFGGDEMGLGTQNPTSHPCPNGPDGQTCNLYANQAVVPQTYGVWRCIETHLGQTSADIWVDGVLTTHYEGIDWVAPTDWDRIQIYRQGADNQYRYEDDYVVATTRVGCAAGGGSSIVLFLTNSAIAISTFLQVLFISGYFWERRSVAVQAAVKFWRYAAEAPSPKEMYWAYRYKKAIKRWQKEAPLMLEYKPLQTIEIPKVQQRIEH